MANDYIQLLGWHTLSLPPQLWISSESFRTLVNVGEGTQRFSSERKIKLTKLSNILVTHVSSRTIGGLVGMLLTIDCSLSTDQSTTLSFCDLEDNPYNRASDTHQNDSYISTSSADDCPVIPRLLDCEFGSLQNTKFTKLYKVSSDDCSTVWRASTYKNRSPVGLKVVRLWGPYPLSRFIETVLKLSFATFRRIDLMVHEISGAHFTKSPIPIPLTPLSSNKKHQHKKTHSQRNSPSQALQLYCLPLYDNDNSHQADRKSPPSSVAPSTITNTTAVASSLLSTTCDDNVNRKRPNFAASCVTEGVHETSHTRCDVNLDYNASSAIPLESSFCPQTSPGPHTYVSSNSDLPSFSSIGPSDVPQKRCKHVTEDLTPHGVGDNSIVAAGGYNDIPPFFNGLMINDQNTNQNSIYNAVPPPPVAAAVEAALFGFQKTPQFRRLLFVGEVPKSYGRFDPVKATKLKVPKGPKFALLKSGQSVQLDDGSRVLPEDVCGAANPAHLFFVIDVPNSLDVIQRAADEITHFLSSSQCRSPSHEDTNNGGVNKRVSYVFHLSTSEAFNSKQYQDLLFSPFKNSCSHEVVHVKCDRSNDLLPIVPIGGAQAMQSVLGSMMPHLFDTLKTHYVQPPMSTECTENVSPHRHGDASDCQHSNLLQATVAKPYNICQLMPMAKLILRPYDKIGIPDLSDYLELLASQRFSQEKLCRLAAAKDVIQSCRQHYDAHILPQVVTTPSIALQPPQSPKSLKPSVMAHEILFLGTGSMMPSKYRNVSATLLRILPKSKGWCVAADGDVKEGGGEGCGGGIGLDAEADFKHAGGEIEDISVLLDCGEGTAGQIFLTSPTWVHFLSTLKSIRVVFLSHRHADHHLGLPSLLWLRHTYWPNQKAPTVIAPQRILQWLKFWHNSINPIPHEFYCCEDLLSFHSTVCPPTAVAVGYDSCSPLHAIGGKRSSSLCDSAFQKAASSLGVVIGVGSSLCGVRGNVKVNLRATVCEVDHVEWRSRPEGFALRVDVLEDATESTATTGATSDWRSTFSVVFSGDTRPCDALVELAKNCDVLIHEATFEDSMKHEAVRRKHSTFTEAYEVAIQADCRHLMLTHFSQRYPKVPPSIFSTPQQEEEKDSNIANDDPSIVVKASSAFPGSSLFAFDCMRVATSLLGPSLSKCFQYLGPVLSTLNSE